MRKISPILVIAAALVLYAFRGPLLGPFQPPSAGGPLTAGDAPREPRVTAPMQVASIGAAAGRAGTANTGTADGETPRGVVETADSDESVPGNAAAIEGRIHRGGSLYVALRRFGVPPADIERTVGAARKIYNLKKVRPGQRFTLYQGGDKGLDSLAFFVGREHCLTIRCTGAPPRRYTASIDTLRYAVTYHVTQGTVRSSIFACLRAQRAEVELASALDEIFGWTVDFFSDIRRGDTFAVLYQRKTFEDGSTTLGDVLSAEVVTRGNRHLAVRFSPSGTAAGYFDTDGRSLQKSLRRVPLKFTRITSSFSGRRFHPVKQRYEPHWGVDYGAPRGTPVYATGDGVVVAATRRSGNGNYVKIKHNNTYTTYYLHLSRFANTVRPGRRVSQGQVIGYVGSTGSATAPHLDYRIKRNGRWVNPRTLKLPSKAPVPAPDMQRFARARDACLQSLQQTVLGSRHDQTTRVARPGYPTGDRMLPVF